MFNFNFYPVFGIPELPCAGPLDCGWEADAGAAGGPGESEFTSAEEGATG